MLSSLVQYRQLIWRHALADVRHRYAGTGMGVVWNVLHPFGLIVIYSLVFGTILATPQSNLGRFGYTLYLCAGFFPWLAFADCLSRGCVAFNANATYLKKLPVPEQVFVAQAATSASIGLLISFALLLIVSLALGLAPSWHWLFIPLPLLLLQMTGLGLGLLLGTVNVFFTDVAQLLALGLQVLFWLTPVVYYRQSLPAWLGRVVGFHPVTPVIDATRALFLDGGWPARSTWLAMLAWALVASLAGALFLHYLRPEIRDVL